MPVKKFINLGKYSKILSEAIVEGTALVVQKNAKLLVRVDDGELRDSIEIDKESKKTHTVFSNAPHATAQEYGRPDLKDYGFTPYLRPAAIQAVSNMNNIVKVANVTALNRSKV